MAGVDKLQVCANILFGKKMTHFINFGKKMPLMDHVLSFFEFLKKNNEKMGFSNRSGPNLMSFTFKRWGRGKNRRESSGKKMSQVREKNDPI